MATVSYSHRPTGAAYVNQAAIQVLLESGKKFGGDKEQSQILPPAYMAYHYGGTMVKKQKVSIETEYNKAFLKIKNAKARKPRTFSHETIRRHMH